MGRIAEGCRDTTLWGMRLRLYPRRNGCEKNALFTPQMFDTMERRVLADAVRRKGGALTPKSRTRRKPAPTKTVEKNEPAGPGGIHMSPEPKDPISEKGHWYTERENPDESHLSIRGAKYYIRAACGYTMLVHAQENVAWGKLPKNACKTCVKEITRAGREYKCPPDVDPLLYAIDMLLKQRAARGEHRDADGNITANVIKGPRPRKIHDDEAVQEDVARLRSENAAKAEDDPTRLSGTELKREIRRLTSGRTEAPRERTPRAPRTPTERIARTERTTERALAKRSDDSDSRAIARQERQAARTERATSKVIENPNKYMQTKKQITEKLAGIEPERVTKFAIKVGRKVYGLPQVVRVVWPRLPDEQNTRANRRMLVEQAGFDVIEAAGENGE